MVCTGGLILETKAHVRGEERCSPQPRPNRQTPPSCARQTHGLRRRFVSMFAKLPARWDVGTLGRWICVPQPQRAVPSGPSLPAFDDTEPAGQGKAQVQGTS